MRHLLMLSLLLLFIPLAPAQRAAPAEYTILLVPSRHGAVRIGRDMQGRENLRLMSYDPASPAVDPFLHVWSDETWVRVPAERFAQGGFFRYPPARVIVVGPPTPLVNTLVEGAARWTTREVLNIESEDPAEMLNSLGRMFNFRARDWRNAAHRYGLELEQSDRGEQHLSWYDTFRASDLSPATSPFRRRRRETEPEPGLRPIIRVEDIPETTETEEPRTQPRTPPRTTGDEEGFSFDENP